jgi:hypothetical protein
MGILQRYTDLEPVCIQQAQQYALLMREHMIPT